MKGNILLGVILVLVLLMSACGPAAATQPPAQMTEPPATQAATESPAATEPPAAIASPAVTATETQAATEAPATDAGIPVTGETEIRATLNETYGAILVNGDGDAVYLYTQDTQNGEASACTDEECLAAWTPLTTQGNPTAGAGALQNLLGTITREDGTLQVTYNGWPLYLYNKGTTSGQGAEGAWFLVTPSGNAMQE